VPFLFALLLGVVLATDPDCATYCPTITQLCNGTNAQFYNKNTTTTFCETVCPIYNVTNDTASWDSYDCRRKHLDYIVGGQDPIVHCPHAGPTGGTVCSDTCNYYCDLVAKACTGTNLIFANKGTCLAECFAYPKDPSANLYTTPASQDSIDCRAYHANLAFGSATADLIALHCGHANTSGGGATCGTGCDNYCDAMSLYCNGTNVKFSDRPTCMTACQKYPHDYSGTPSTPVTAGNSFECRKYHVIVASMGDTTLHCGHAAADGGKTCVSTSGALESAKIWGLSILLPIVWLILNR